MAAFAGPNTDEDGLVFALDAGNTKSYPGSGTTWTDLSGNNNTGTLTNGPTFSSDDGGYIDFDGTNDRVETSSDMFAPNANFTFSVWIKLDTVDSTGTIISDFTDTGSIQIAYAAAASGIRIVKSNISTVDTFSNSALSANIWYHITITRQSNTYNLYIDGSFISTFTDTKTYSRGAQSIGVNYNGNSAFDGKISSIYCYSRTLSAAEVEQNYNATKGRYGY